MTNQRRIRPAVQAAFLLVGVVAISAFHIAANAQSEQGSASAAPICMSHLASNETRLHVILPATDQDALKAKGFEPEPCDEHFGSLEAREAWRDKVCELAAIKAPEFHEQYEIDWGVRPNALCGMAEIASSQWKRGRK